MVLEGKSEAGLDVKVTFKGKPALFNFCDNDKSEVKRPWSTLTENYKLNFTANTAGIYFRDDPSIVENLNTYTLWITDLDMDKGDYFQFQFMTSADNIADGTYTVATTFADNTILPGWLGYGGDICGSWFADMNTAQEGVATVVAPVTEGTFTVSTEGDLRKIVFNLKDDNGKTITGEFKGLLVDGDEMHGQAPQKSKIAKKPRLSVKK